MNDETDTLADRIPCSTVDVRNAAQRCGAAQASQPSAEDDPAAAAQETAATEDTQPQEEPTLESLLGEDYVQYLTETITMQMGNRMEKNPDVRYYPIEDNAPLSDYVTIDEHHGIRGRRRGQSGHLVPGRAP